MYVYIVLCGHSKSDISAELYHNYYHAFDEAKKLMVLEIKKVYGNNSTKDDIDDQGVKFRDYTKILNDEDRITIKSCVVEIIRKQVQ